MMGTGLAIRARYANLGINLRIVRERTQGGGGGWRGEGGGRQNFAAILFACYTTQGCMKKGKIGQDKFP